MKKKLLIAILILLIIGAGVSVGMVVVMQMKGRQPADFEKVLPEGPLVYWHAKDVEKNWGRFTASAFWQKIAALDYEKALLSSGVKEKDMAVFRQLNAKMAEPQTRQFFSRFLGQEVAVAAYPMEVASFSPEALREMMNNVFLVTRLSKQAQFAEFLGGVLNIFGPGVTTQEVKYKDRTITLMSVEAAAITIGYVRINDVVVFGIGDKAAKASVDVIQGAVKPLASDPRYLTAKGSFLPSSSLETFMNLEGLLSKVKNQMLNMVLEAPVDQQESLKLQFDRDMRQFEGLLSIGYSAAFEQTGRLKVDLHYDKARLDPALKAMYECSPQENRSLALVPQDALGYQWTACYDLGIYWQQAKEEMINAAQLSKNAISPEQIVADIERSIGLNIEKDILPAFGTEVGGFLKDIEIKEPFPLPGIVIFLSVRDQAQADKVIQTLLQQRPDLVLEMEDYKGSTIKFMSMPMAEDLKPSYAYVGNYLVLATRPQLIKETIDTLADGTLSIAGNPDFKAIDPQLAGSSNSVFFLNSQKLMLRVERLLDWAIQYQAAQLSKREAFKKGSAQRVQDMTTLIENQEKELAQLKTQFDAETAADPQIAEQVKRTEAAVAADRAKVQELQELLKIYDQQSVDPEKDKAIINGFIRPMVLAVAHWRVVSTRVLMKDGIIETFIHYQLE